MRRFALASARGGGRATTTMLVARAYAVTGAGGGFAAAGRSYWRPAALRASSSSSSSVANAPRNRTTVSAANASSSSFSSALPPPIEPSSRSSSRLASPRSSPTPSGSRGLSSAGGLGDENNADADGERRLILIDGTALLYRCYFSLGAGGAGGGARLTSPLTGEDTSVAHGFVAQLLRLLELDPAPTHAAAVFDAPGKTFRHALYPEYKGHRPPSPPAVAAAAPLVRRLLRRALGVADLSAPGVEADDLIGALAVRGVREGLRVAVVSPDKDFYQLLRPGLQLLRPVPASTGGFSKSSASSSSSSSPLSVVTVAGLVPYTEATFLAEQGGLLPSQWADARALAGDPSDNVPGVAGIGAKTACSLVREFGSLEAVLERAAEVKRPSARAALLSEEGRRAARLSRRLLEIRTDLDLPPARLDWGSLELFAPRSSSSEDEDEEGPEGDAAAKERALGALRELGMESSASRLEGVWEAAEARRGLRRAVAAGAAAAAGSLAGLLRPASELLVAGAPPPLPPTAPSPSQQPPSSSRAAAA